MQSHRAMTKKLQPQLDAAGDSDSDSSEDGDFLPSGSGRCSSQSFPLHAALVFVSCNCFCSGSDSDAPDSDISDGEVKKVSADAGDVVHLAAAAAGKRATRASGAPNKISHHALLQN
jgi:hypothetical protein